MYFTARKKFEEKNGSKAMCTSWAWEASGRGPQSVWEWGAPLTVGVGVFSHLESPAPGAGRCTELPACGDPSLPRGLGVGLLPPSALAAQVSSLPPPAAHPLHCTHSGPMPHSALLRPSEFIEHLLCAEDSCPQ